MGMLRSFLEIGSDPGLFRGLKIMEEASLCERYMGKFPVISVSLKGIDAANYHDARSMAVKLINEEARKVRFLLESSHLDPEDKKLFAALLDEQMPDSTLCYSLRELSELLRKHYGQKVIILIDEYDVQFDEYFGFTDAEVKKMLMYYEIEDAYPEVKNWYDGYRFGNVEVYCPWDGNSLPERTAADQRKRLRCKIKRGRDE